MRFIAITWMGHGILFELGIWAYVMNKKLGQWSMLVVSYGKFLAVSSPLPFSL